LQNEPVAATTALPRPFPGGRTGHVADHGEGPQREDRGGTLATERTNPTQTIPIGNDGTTNSDVADVQCTRVTLIPNPSPKGRRGPVPSPSGRGLG